MKFNGMGTHPIVAAIIFLSMLATSSSLRAESELWDAFTMHRYQQAEKLIRDGWFVNVNEQNSYGAPLIHHAVHEGTPALVELLISKGADVNAKGRFDRVALHYANMPGMAEVLLRHGATVDSPTNYGETPLHWAASSLNSLGRKVDLAGFAEALIAHGADVNKRTGVGRSYRTPLSYAAEWNNLDVAKVLIAHGADVNTGSLDPAGKKISSPLNVTKGVEMAKLLVSRGALVNQPESNPPLISVASSGLTPMIEFLISQGADPNATSDSGLTALYAAAGSDYYASAVDSLLNHGAKIDAKNFSSGTTALSQATSQQAVQIVDLLLSRGANPNAANNDGYTPLAMAVTRGSKEIVELLLKKGANANAKISRSGETPFLIAMSEGSLQIAKLLIQYGADVEAVRLTSRYLARNNPAMLQLLEQHGY